MYYLYFEILKNLFSEQSICIERFSNWHRNDCLDISWAATNYRILLIRPDVRLWVSTENVQINSFLM